MHALALLMSAGSTTAGAATSGLPYFHLGAINVGLPIQWFGMIVAAGVLIGAVPLRRYAEWHGVSDELIRGLLTWVMVSGFLGAHEFDMIAYQWERIGETAMQQPAGWWFLPESLWPSNWPLPFRIWDGISSYGGFLGGALGFALFVWWKRQPTRLFADITIVGLLPAFSIGRIGCTVVSDHIGSAVEPTTWYSFLAMDYPRTAAFVKLKTAAGELRESVVNQTLAQLFEVREKTTPGIVVDHLPAWNLGLIEFLYLVPVNLLVLWLAFNPKHRRPAGVATVLTGLLYAPVRFFLDFLRPEDTDPRHLGLTFAQWSSILAFGVAGYALSRILKTGQVAQVMAPTSAEMQKRLRRALNDEQDARERAEEDKQAEAERKQAALTKAREEREREDAELEAAAMAAGKSDGEADRGAGSDDDVADDPADEEAALEAKAKADNAKAADSKAADSKAADAKADAAAKPAAGAAKPGVSAAKPGAAKSGGGKGQPKKR